MLEAAGPKGGEGEDAAARAARARALWPRFEALTAQLAQELAEQLRLILEPSLASKLQGDFRGGRGSASRISLGFWPLSPIHPALPPQLAAIGLLWSSADLFCRPEAPHSPHLPAELAALAGDPDAAAGVGAAAAAAAAAGAAGDLLLA